MSVTAVSTSASLLERTLEAALNSTSTSGTTQTTSTSATSLSAASTASGATGSSLDTLTQDMVTLLKALASGDVSGAKTDLAKLKTDLATQESKDTSSTLSKDMTSLLKDLTTGNASAAKTDITKLKTDLQAEDASSSSTSQSTSSLDTLIANMTKSLNSGSVQGALQDLASYLVQNGQGTGSLVNTSA